MHNENVISNQNVEIYSIGKKKSMIEIHQVRLQDQGNYTCVASNSVGTDRMSTKLEIVGNLCKLKK